MMLFLILWIELLGLFHKVNEKRSVLFEKSFDPEKHRKCSKTQNRLKTSDKVLRYGENNQVEFSEHPTVVQRGNERTINIYAAIPDAA